MMTWTAPEIAVRVRGPAQAQSGAMATYQIEVANTGDAPVSEVVLTNRVPAGLRYQSSTVPADTSPCGLEWRIGELGAGQTQTIDVNYEVTGSGTIRNCVVANTSESLTAEDCATTTVLQPTLEVRVTGPDTARLGERVTFAITVTNRGSTPATNVTIKDTFDPGLEHDVAKSPIDRELGTLAAGSSRDDLGVTFRVTQLGRLCQTVEVTGDGFQPTREVHCINVASDGQPPATEPPVAPPPATEPPADVPLPMTTPQPGLRVDKRGPPRARVGDKIVFDLTITNTGDTDLTDVKVVDKYERGLVPIRVSEGWAVEDEKLTWTFPIIRPGESRQLQVETRCDEALRACSRASVTAAGGLVVADEACLQIDPAPPGTDESPPGGARLEPAPENGETQPALPGAETGGPALKLQITDLRDEVAVGRTVTYEVTITNPRNSSDRNVELVVNVPVGMTPLTVGTVAPSNFTINGRVVRFNPVSEIRPGETLIYRIPVRADRAGRFVVEAKAISGGQKDPLLVTEETNIYSEGTRRTPPDDPRRS